MALAQKQLHTRFKQLSDEKLLAAYKNARNKKLDDEFLNMLLDEMLQRDIYGLLFETSSHIPKEN